ncbi:MAG: AIR carboxylase family protein [Planctomycetota bacterium]
MAIGKAGATNAAIFAAQILAVSDEELAGKLDQFKQAQAEKVRKKDADLQKQV